MKIYIPIDVDKANANCLRAGLDVRFREDGSAYRVGPLASASPAIAASGVLA